MWYTYTIIKRNGVLKMEMRVDEMHVTPNFKNEWKIFREPVKTLDDLQEALDISSDSIWLRVVNVMYGNTIKYVPLKCDELSDDTKIELIGAQVTKDGAIAIVRIIIPEKRVTKKSKYRRPY